MCLRARTESVRGRSHLLRALEHSFFKVVNIEEELHFARRMAELRDVGFEIFLGLRSEIAETQATHLVIPFDDRCLILLRCVFSDPAINFFIGRAGRNELLEFQLRRDR